MGAGVCGPLVCRCTWMSIPPDRTSITGAPDLQRKASHCGHQGSSGHVIGRSWPRFTAPDLHRNSSRARPPGIESGSAFGTLAAWGNRLAVVYRGPHTFSRQRGDVSDRVLVGMAICRQVP